MRLIAADAAFNHGSGKAKKLIKKANGDPFKLLSLRKAEYDRLKKAGLKSIADGKGDPKNYVGSHSGWMNRLQKLEGKLSGDNADLSSDSVQKRAREIDAEFPGAGQELIDLYDNKLSAQEKAKTLEMKALTTEAREKIAGFEGDYTKIPTVERAKYAKAGIDIKTLYKDASDPVAVTELTLLDPDQLLEVDIDEAYGDRLKFDDIQSWKEKQKSLDDPQNKYIEQQIDGIVNHFFLSEGLDITSGGKDSNKPYVANMKNYIQNVAHLEHKSGNKVTPKMLNNLAGEYILSAKNSLNKGWFSAFNGDTDALKFKYTDVPKEKANEIRNSLIENGQAGTDREILTIYLRGKANK